MDIPVQDKELPGHYVTTFLHPYWGNPSGRPLPQGLLMQLVLELAFPLSQL